MKWMSTLLVMLPLLGSAQNVEDLPEMCAAAYMHANEDERLALWKGRFNLRTDVLIEYRLLLKRYEDEDDLPAELLQEAISECDRVLSELQSQEINP